MIDSLWMRSKSSTQFGTDCIEVQVQIDHGNIHSDKKSNPLIRSKLSILEGRLHTSSVPQELPFVVQSIQQDMFLHPPV